MRAHLRRPKRGFPAPTAVAPAGLGLRAVRVTHDVAIWLGRFMAFATLDNVFLTLRNWLSFSGEVQQATLVEQYRTNDLLMENNSLLRALLWHESPESEANVPRPPAHRRLPMPPKPKR